MAHPPTVQGQPAVDADRRDAARPQQPLLAHAARSRELPRARTRQDGHPDAEALAHGRHAAAGRIPLSALSMFGLPRLSVDRPIVLVNVRPGQSATPAEVRISNTRDRHHPVAGDRQQVVGHRLAAGGRRRRQRSARACRTRPATARPCCRSPPIPNKVLGSDAAVVKIEGLGDGGAHRWRSPSSFRSTSRSVSPAPARTRAHFAPQTCSRARRMSSRSGVVRCRAGRAARPSARRRRARARETAYRCASRTRSMRSPSSR